MLKNLENFSSATKAIFEFQIATYNVLATKVVEGQEKVIAFNVAAAKACADEFNFSVKQFISAENPHAFFTIAMTQAKQNVEKADSYGRHVIEIVSNIKADFTKTAELQIVDAKAKGAAWVDEVIKKAPAGSKNACAMMKLCIGNANVGFEQVTRAHKQAVETMKSHVALVTDQMTQAGKITAL